MKIAFLSDFDLRGSGYLSINLPLGNGLSKLGYDIKAIGLGYRGEEHPHKFSIIPAANVREQLAILQNLKQQWNFDAMMVAMDIPAQEMIMKAITTKDFPYIGIMPVEADPLCVSWAMILMSMDKAFIISKFGTKEAKNHGIEQAELFQVGIDTESWRVPTPEEKATVRESLGFGKDEFIVLTIAANQERKNLSGAMEMFRRFSEDKPNVKWVLVTLEHFVAGWRLRDLAIEYDVNDKFLIFERGMPFKHLWSLYAASDVFLLPSKAEGLGLPLLEAMACGVPCMATDCTGMKELLANDRGVLIPWDYKHRDPFGNGNRYMADIQAGADILEKIYEDRSIIPILTNKARKYVEKRKWDIPIQAVHRYLQSLPTKG